MAATLVERKAAVHSQTALIHVIDSHTGGEPTRVVIEGAPSIPPMDMASARNRLQQEFDHYRRAIVCEPRGSDVLVGAYLLPSQRPDCAAGVVFFNNVGYLGMCGHGTIGVVATLAHLGRVQPGDIRLETPVGVITASLHADGQVSVANVASYRYRKQVPVLVPGFGTVHGDIAWGGNWFFLVTDHGCQLTPQHLDQCLDVSRRIRAALTAQNITGADGAEIDHVELLGPGSTGSNGRNYVLCPGLAYDRSPCGTGTSAKLACLAADHELAPGQIWVQESIIGSRFRAHYQRVDGQIMPVITGQAFVNADAMLMLDPGDPFVHGILA